MFAGRSDRERTRRARRTALMRTAKPCGPGTRCWCQAGGGFSNPTGFRSAANSLATVTRRIRRRGEHGISRKAIAQGMPECSDCTCMLVCAFLCASCTRDRGCSKHPAFPAPSLWAEDFCKPRAYRVARSYSVVITRLVRNCALGRVIQYSRGSSEGNDRPRRTGCPAFAGHDSLCCGNKQRPSKTQ